jgi:hypothetical protein
MKDEYIERLYNKFHPKYPIGTILYSKLLPIEEAKQLRIEDVAYNKATKELLCLTSIYWADGRIDDGWQNQVYDPDNFSGWHKRNFGGIE